jgi:hypothetical protein
MKIFTAIKNKFTVSKKKSDIISLIVGIGMLSGATLFTFGTSDAQMLKLKSLINGATVGFGFDSYLVDETPQQVGSGDEYFANVVDKCTFHTDESFSPMCVICKLSDSNGNLVAQGIIGESFDQGDYAGSTTIQIDLVPNPQNPLSNDVQKVQRVEASICGEIPQGGNE